jgi:tripartite ATP-independent transporter DctP family solute receptor
MKLTRRKLIVSASSLSAPWVITAARAQKAEFSVKFGSNLPAAHPINTRAVQMAAKLKAESKGRIDLQVFPFNQLGNDTDMLSQLRSGALDFMTLSPLILGTLVPAAQINGVGFAFKDYSQVWSAMDGELGAHVRQQIAATGSIFAFDKIWDNGYRHITNSVRPINTPDDLKGLKLRTPPGPMWVSMFKALDASPTPLNFAEVYSALQTKVVEGQENPLAIISTAKLNEVQKYCSMTGHMWDGYWFMGNKKLFERFPADLQSLMSSLVAEYGLLQRSDVKQLNDSLQSDLKAKGMVFNDVQTEAFRAKLRSAGFYSEWRKKFGEEAWTQLEKYTGKLS